MKRALLSLALLLAAITTFAMPVEVTVDSWATSYFQTEDLIKLGSQIQNSIAMLDSMNQMVQYQYQALKTLSSGTWDGLVQFSNQETQALGNFNNAVDQLHAINPSLDLTDLTKAAQNAYNISAAGSNVLNSANAVYQNASTNYKNLQAALADSHNADSIVNATQAVGETLGALGSSMNDIETLLYASQQFENANYQAQTGISLINQQAVSNFLYSPDYTPFQSGTASQDIKNYISGQYYSDRVPN